MATRKTKKTLLKGKMLILSTCGVVALSLVLFAGSGGDEIKQLPMEEVKNILSEEGIAELKDLPPEKRKKELASCGYSMGMEFSRVRRADGNNNRPSGERPDNAEREQRRKAMEQLSEEDRKAFRDGMHKAHDIERKARNKEMNDRIAKFFEASKEDQERLLDEEIARFEERHKRHEEERKKRESQNASASKSGDGGKDNNNRRPPWHNISKEQREEHFRNRLDDSTPEQRAQRNEFFRRLREKRESKK